MSEIEDCFKRFIKRDDIDIILINQNIAELIRHVIDGHTQPIPAVLEIPSKDHPYDPSKDSILRRAKVSYVQVMSKIYPKFGFLGNVQSRRLSSISLHSKALVFFTCVYIIHSLSCFVEIVSINKITSIVM